MKNMLCCGKQVNEKKLNNGQIGLWCTICGRKGSAQTKEQAYIILQSSNPAIMVPDNPSQLPLYIAGHMKDIALLAAPFISKDKPALDRLIKKNIRYIISQKDPKFLQCWSTPEGRESIVYAMEEAFQLGAMLPEMGCIIPYGKVVEFIPAVEAYEFATTNGENAPFEWLRIKPIHENDIYKITESSDGEIKIELEYGIPRGDLVSIAIYGKNRKHNKIIGEVYDKKRLIEKAKIHSPSYKYYLQDLNSFNVLQSEGKTLFENGREYFEKTCKGKNGPYQKKIFADEIINPYEGPDQVEMLRKSAGKTFLKKYIRVRNSEAAINEIKEDEEKDIDSLVDKALTGAFENIPGDNIENINIEDVIDTDEQTNQEPEKNINQSTGNKNNQETFNFT